jgi:hypothetical protein
MLRTYNKMKSQIFNQLWHLKKILHVVFVLDVVNKYLISLLNQIENFIKHESNEKQTYKQ